MAVCEQSVYEGKLLQRSVAVSNWKKLAGISPFGIRKDHAGSVIGKPVRISDRSYGNQ